MWVDLRLHLFLCVVVIQKNSKDNFSWDVFAAQFSPILNCKIPSLCFEVFARLIIMDGNSTVIIMLVTMLLSMALLCEEATAAAYVRPPARPNLMLFAGGKKSIQPDQVWNETRNVPKGFYI